MIRVSVYTRDILRSLGRKNDSYDFIISKLLAEAGHRWEPSMRQEPEEKPKVKEQVQEPKPTPEPEIKPTVYASQLGSQSTPHVIPKPVQVQPIPAAPPFTGYPTPARAYQAAKEFSYTGTWRGGFRGEWEQLGREKRDALIEVFGQYLFKTQEPPVTAFPKMLKEMEEPG